MTLAEEILTYLRDAGPATPEHLVRMMGRLRDADSCDTLDTLVALYDAGEIEPDTFGAWMVRAAA